MKRLLTLIIVMTGIFLWSCEDPADELFQQVEPEKSIKGPTSPENEDADGEDEAGFRPKGDLNGKKSSS